MIAAVAALERQSAVQRPIVLEVVADRVLVGPAPVPFVVPSGQVQARLGYVGVRRLDRAIDRLFVGGLLAIVREADPKAHRCRLSGLAPRRLGDGAR